jgi:hypothetical protein
MAFDYLLNTHIVFPVSLFDSVITHCKNNLEMNGGSLGNAERKAFGLVAGRLEESAIQVCRCFPLAKNARTREPYKSHMDHLMANHAIRSETPLNQRGWVAEPEELMEKIHLCQDEGHILLGTYHMHRVSWAHDPVRDTPTQIDTVLAEKNRLIMFIISMVNPDQPIIRAFHEGILACEYPIITR